jgi:hypothetical protein
MRFFLPSVFALAASCLVPNAHAGPVIPASTCLPDFSVCSVYENQVTDFGGFIAASGDVVIHGGNGGTVAVFRIFSDFFDSGGGTGLGSFAFLYSDAFSNLPAPSTYSVNAVSVPLGPEVAGGFSETVYIGAFGTEFDIFTEAPEPSSFALLALGGLLLARRRSRA